MSRAQNPFFSIIIPTFNRSSLIANSIESVIKQTFTNWELIIIDDGSLDNTAEIVEKYLKISTKIKYYYQVNKGRSSARNKGIEVANGKYLCFLDDDDYYLEKFLEEFYNEIELRNFDDAVFYCRQYEKINSKIIKADNDKEMLKSNLLKMYFKYSNVQSLCTSYNIIRDIRFDERFDLAEDFHFFARILLYSNCHFINKYLCVAVIHDEGTMKNELNRGYFYNYKYNRLDVFEDLLNNYSTGLKQKKVYSDLINMNNKIAYFYESSILKNCKKKKHYLNRFIFRLPYTSPIFFYYITSIIIRYPYYLIKCFLKNDKN